MRVFNLTIKISSILNDVISNFNISPLMNGFVSNILYQNEFVPYMQNCNKTTQFVLQNKSLTFSQNPYISTDYYGLMQHPLFKDSSLSINMKSYYIHELLTFSPSLLYQYIPYLYKITSTETLEQIQLHTSLLTTDLFILVNRYINVLVPQNIDLNYLQETLKIDSLESVESKTLWKSLPIAPVINQLYSMNPSMVNFIVVGSQKYLDFVAKSFIFENNEYQQFI